jgi:hypothetical protein
MRYPLNAGVTRRESLSGSLVRLPQSLGRADLRRTRSPQSLGGADPLAKSQPGRVVGRAVGGAMT